MLSFTDVMEYFPAEKCVSVKMCKCVNEDEGTDTGTFSHLHIYTLREGLPSRTHFLIALTSVILASSNFKKPFAI
jgi:hypothetical protein